MRRHSIGRDSVVVVMGASSGIGRAAAHAFARRGARLVLAARSSSSLDDVAGECRARGAARVTTAPLDITDADAVADMIAATERAYGGIDVWVSASSVYGFSRFEESPAHMVRRILDVNLIGTMEAARLAIPVLRRRRGVMILVGSVFSELAAPYVVPYVTSKHGIAGFAKGLRLELRGQVDVCTVMPATIDTPIHQHAANHTGRKIRPLPPVVAPERVARAIVRLSRRPRRNRVVGRAQGVMVPIRRVLPGVVDAFTARYMELVGIRRSPQPPHDGTLHVPDPPSNTVEGGWRVWRRLWRGRRS
ncbi:SDR family NAD(P)-dependent oxidoreductase [Microbacterium sp. Marseille-Q6965]|uniref:SDR family NAD(P)-dependent oxidoreductase n=1 Tax=Microbacterium sp. Marseille-Q6965 TaxID=2965072 RepID=UPI0021B827B9|nr:SDR family NAD(P)-dependent oxidoreductase [Microbacterium sp. Marseille-Q6965]